MPAPAILHYQHFIYSSSITRRMLPKNGVETEEEVNATQINGVRVRFIPEVERNVGRQVTTRSMVNTRIVWEEWGKASTALSFKR